MNKRTSPMYLSCGLILAAGVTVFAFLLALLREMLHTDALMSAHAAGLYLYCLAAAVPFISAVVMLMMVIREIGRDRAFSIENARWMRCICAMGALECAYILLGAIGWSIVGIMHPSVLIVAAALIFLGSGISILAWALSKLILKASAIQQENDLTI